MGTFERTFDTLYRLVFNTIYIALIPFMIWGFFTQYDTYQKKYSKPSWVERRLAQQEVMMNKVVKEDSLKKSHPVQKREAPLQERGVPLPIPKYFPGDNNFNIPLQQLLEGNHGRLL